MSKKHTVVVNKLGLPNVKPKMSLPKMAKAGFNFSLIGFGYSIQWVNGCNFQI